MQITVTDTARFTDTALAVARQLPTRPVAPVLAGMLIETENDAIVLCGTDGDTTIRARVPAEITTPGRVVVSGRLLAEIVKLLPRRELHLHADGEAAHLRCGASSAMLPLLGEEFPQLPAAPRTVAAADATGLAAAVSRVAAAASGDEVQVRFRGIALDLPAPGGPLRLFATDSYQLATAAVTLTEHTSPARERVMVPAKAFDAAVRSLAADDSTHIRLGLGDDQDGRVGLATDHRSVVLHRLDVPPIGYEAVLAQPTTTALTLPVSEFAAALRRLALYRDAPKVRVRLAENTLSLHVAGPSGRSDEEIHCDYTGPDREVGFITHRLASTLATIDTDLVHLSLPASPARPWALRPVDEHGQVAQRFTHLVTPAKLATDAHQAVAA